MKANFVKVAAMIGLASSLCASSWGIITNGTVNVIETGQLDGISFNADFGSAEVSDLSSGGLRFNRQQAGTGGTQITTENLAITSQGELSFDWSVDDNSWYRDRAYYQIDDLDLEAIMLHDGTGKGSANGSVIRLLEPGNYQLIVSTFYNFDEGDYDIGTYDFTLSNLRVTGVGVPDSSLGILGIASILGIFVVHRRFRIKKS